LKEIDALAEAAGMTRWGYVVRATLGIGKEKRLRAKSRGAKAG
jgi:hypothetical protein